jgi:hypothetical protein
MVIYVIVIYVNDILDIHHHIRLQKAATFRLRIQSQKRCVVLVETLEMSEISVTYIKTQYL